MEYAINLITTALKRYPWDISLYERKIKLCIELGMLARDRDEIEMMNVYWDEAINTFNQVTQKKKENEANIEFHNTYWDFTNKFEVAISLSHIHMLRGNFSESSTILKDLVSDDMSDAENREVIRWYLASLFLQGKEDKELLKKLVEVDSQAEKRIKDLIESFR